VSVKATEVQHFNIEVNGQPIPARHGQTMAAVLLAAGHRIFRRTVQGEPRGFFCGMGVCFDCLVTVNGLSEQRACMTPVQSGMQVQLQIGQEDGNGDD
jgi:predicted molibdopterin-dependent oxidoreductase YjgC